MGKGNRVPMAEFRAALEALGCTAVQTLLNSGNAVFSSTRRNAARLAEDIAAEVRARLGVVTPVIVKTAAEFDAIVQGNPMTPSESESPRFLVALSMDPARLQELASLRPLLKPGERLAITEHAAYLHCSGGLLQSKAAEVMLGKAVRGITTRNWATTSKLAGLLNGPSPIDESPP